uniref:Uncharacterized protein n=1 Tax=Plectus sambesii TaxID=2011161 RepID=A0A914WCK8_9BILA
MGPPGNHPFPDLMMDISAMTTGPLLQGDPMISAAGGGPSPRHAPSQLSPEVQWDQANFSPESDGGTNNPPNQMDFS